MQPYRLGIDIGTASVACAAFALDEKRTPTGVIHCAARIFEEPLQPASGGGVGEPKKAARRIARQQRRQHHRRAGRLRKLAAMGADIGVDPRKTPSDSGQTIHQIRADAAEKAVSLPDLFRVFLHLAKRRGYMGVFREPKEKKAPVKKTAAAESDKPSRGEVREGVEGLREEIREKCGENGTLGRYMNWRVQNGMDLRLKTHGLYADKEMVEREFDRIWKTQAANHSILREGGDALREEFRREIFFKRPLRSPAPMVGNCALEPDLPRAPMAHPAAQELRMEQAIADLEFVAPGRRRREPLSEPQREVVRKMLREKHEVKFDKMAEEMRQRRMPPAGRYVFQLRQRRARLVEERRQNLRNNAETRFRRTMARAAPQRPNRRRQPPRRHRRAGNFSVRPRMARERPARKKRRLSPIRRAGGGVHQRPCRASQIRTPCRDGI